MSLSVRVGTERQGVKGKCEVKVVGECPPPSRPQKKENKQEGHG